MLNSLRSLAGSLGAKILLLLLVVSFGVWGVGDMLRSSSHGAAVATVGDATITSNQFARYLHLETENLRRVMGDSYSPDLRQNSQLSRWVLQKLINTTLLRQEAEALSLLPGDADVVRKIRSNPEFQDSKGNFDKTIFEARLRGAGASEKSYIDDLRQEMAVTLLMDTITATAPVSDLEVRTLFKAREEERSVTLYDLSPAAVGNVSVPGDDEVKHYYDAHNREFTAPEYRSFSYVTMTAKEVSQIQPVSSEELETQYRERLEEFKRPEKRGIQQLLYATENKANHAASLLKQGKSFEQVAKETAALNKDSISMGKIERGALIGVAGDAAFDLKLGEVSPVMQSPFGWHIFKTVSIDPAATLSLEEARPALEKDLQQRHTDEAMVKLANQLEDDLAGGSSLAEAARALGLKVLTAGPVDNSGKTPGGVPAKDLPALDKFLETGFKLEDKADSPLMTAKGGAVYVLHVDNITPERLKALEEVRGLVAAGWQQEEREKKLEALAQELSEKFRNASLRRDLIGSHHLSVLAQATFKRNTHEWQNMLLPAMMMPDIFALDIQQSSKAYPLRNGHYVLAVLNTIIPTVLNDNDPKQVASLADIRTNTRKQVENEILDQYTRYLTGKYPVAINDTAVQAVLQ